MADPVESLLKFDYSEPDRDYDVTARTGTTPDGLGETFARGFDVGLENIQTDNDYFKGLFNTVIGDEEAAAENIAAARAREQRTSTSFGELQDFEGFVENPTVGGFFTQISKNLGQITPYVGATLSSGLAGAAVSGLTKLGVSAGSRHVTKRLVRDAFEKKLKGEATPEEERVLAVSYRLAQRNNAADKITLKGGAAAGMYGQEYSSMAGSNFGENLDFLDDEEAALRSAGLAVPQAFIGLKGEQLLTRMLMKDLGDLAAKRSTRDGSSFAKLAKNLARGGATEGVAETLQEGISVANRFDIDPEYTAQDAALRMGESAFAGFFGGLGISGAGSATVGTFRGAQNVMGKAKDYIEQARQQQVDAKIDGEQYGVDSMGFTTPEPQSSVNAQVRAAVDPTTARHSIWVEGPNPEYDASETETKEVEIEAGVDGDGNVTYQKFYTRFIPGRGTIISKNFDIVEEVAESQANEESLAAALQYSDVKPIDGDIVVEALDREGNVVWQQGTNEDGLAGAFSAAGSQVPAGGSVRRRSVQEALEERQTLFNQEQGPQVRNIDAESFEDGFSDIDNELKVDQELGFEIDEFGIGSTELGDAKEINIGNEETYKPRSDGNRVFDSTNEARSEFAAAFEDVDLSDLGKDEFTGVSFAEGSKFALMSDAFLRQAAKAKRENPGTDIFVIENEDGSHSLMQTVSPEAELFGFDSRTDTLLDPAVEAEIDAEAARAEALEAELDAEEAVNQIKDTNELRPGLDLFDQQPKEAPPAGPVEPDPLQRGEDAPRVIGGVATAAQFIRNAIKKAKESRFARQRRTKKGWVNKKPEELVTVDGVAVNLVDLVKDGQRLFSIEQRGEFTQGGRVTAMRNGLFQVIGSLIAEGRVVKIGGYDIRSKLLKDLQDISTQIAQEEQAVADAALEWDLDPDSPDLNARLAEVQQYLSEVEGRVAQGRRADREARRNSPLDRLKIQRAKWARDYAEYQKQKEQGAEGLTEPVKPPLLALMDVQAGMEDGRSITVGKLLNKTPENTPSKDSTYTLTNEDGFVVFEGNKQQVQEEIESSNRPYIISKNGKRLTDEEFAQERNVGFNDRPTNFRPDEPVADTPSEDLRPIGFSEQTTDADADYAFDPEAENLGDLKPLGVKAGTIAARVVDIARRTLNLDKPTSVLSVRELLRMDNFEDAFSDPRVAAYVKEVAEQLIADPQGGGRYIGFGDAHIILVDESAGKNDLDTALIVAHELGHALFKEQLSSTLKNPALYNRLFDEFQKARDADDAPTAYRGKHGFEEWYADQTANWAIAEYAKDRKKGLVGAHFQKVARKLKQFYKAFSADMKKRFGRDAASPEFRGYMDEVIRRRSEGSTASGAQTASMQEKVIVRKMAEVVEKQQPGFVGAVNKKVQQLIRSDGFTPVYNFIFTADSRLRKIAGNKVADLFYGRAQQANGKGRNKLGFIKTSMLEGNRWFNKLEDAIDGDLDSPEVQADIDIAFSDTPTRDLTNKNAIAVRKWFDQFYDEYIEPSQADIGRQTDYAPVVLKLSEIEQNPDVLIKLILESDPEAKPADIKFAVQKLVDYQQAVMDGAPIDIKGTNPAQSAEAAIKLTKAVGRDKLKAAGLLEDTDVALMTYITKTVKRVEWKRNTEDEFGNSIYEEELRKLSGKDQAEVQKIVHKYLGYQESPLSPMWRTINSWGSVLQIFAILPLAVLGSIPELAGPVIASKEFSSVTEGMKEIVRSIRNRDEARALARDLGVVTSQSVANIMMSQAELDFMSEGARKLTDGFFRVTLLDTYTKFTREFASNMGVRFIIKHADIDGNANAFSKKYLDELGVSAADVQAWSKSDQNFNTPEGQRVRMALQRFVESSTLRPNAAERPLWASDPHWALFWQLKGFFYSYGKVMLAGARREAASRLNGATATDASKYAALTGAAGVFALMGIATMPLAMVGMELREYAKFGLAYAIPGIDHDAKDYFRTDNLSWPEYLGAAFDRSFAAGPITIAQQAMQAADWGRGVTGAAAVVAGPTAETVQRIFTDGFSSTFENRMLPTGLL